MTDPNTVVPDVPTTPTPPAEILKVVVPATASAEIIRLHKELVNAAQNMEQKRAAFNEFIRAARLALGIPSNEIWELLGDASAFQKIPQPVAPTVPYVDAGVAQSASPEATIAQ